MQAVWGLSEPTLQGWMNEHVDSELRATVLSVRSMAFTLGGGIGLVCLGLVARGQGIPAAWGVAAACLLVSAPGFLLLGGGRRAEMPPAAAVPEAVP
jgi:predicted MFS family arabinose efflux permease